MKKKIIFLIVFIILIGGGIGISVYTNSPEYVIKQYVKAINSKNQKALEKISYTADEFNIIDIQEAYDRKRAYKITSYELYGIMDDPDSIENFPKIIYKNPENVKGVISKVADYKVYGDNTKINYQITLGYVNGKWRVVECPLFLYK